MDDKVQQETEEVHTAGHEYYLLCYVPLPFPSPPPSFPPSQIIVAKPDHTFELDYETLQEILLTEEVRDRKVVVLSVAGPFRKGKSFLLDFIIRYLEKQVRHTLTNVHVYYNMIV